MFWVHEVGNENYQIVIVAAGGGKSNAYSKEHKLNDCWYGYSHGLAANFQLGFCC